MVRVKGRTLREGDAIIQIIQLCFVSRVQGRTRVRVRVKGSG